MLFIDFEANVASTLFSLPSAGKELDYSGNSESRPVKSAPVSFPKRIPRCLCGCHGHKASHGESESIMNSAKSSTPLLLAARCVKAP